MNPKLAVLALTISATILAGCIRAPAETSFGIHGSAFHCEAERCDVVFFLNNQTPNSVSVEYQAELTNEREEVVSDFAGVIEVPALEKIKVSKTVVVTGQPDRLGVTVADLQHMTFEFRGGNSYVMTHENYH